MLENIQGDSKAISESVQNNLKFQQFSLLRKVLQQKATGTFLFDLATGERGMIKINRGNIIGEHDDAIAQLSSLLTEPVVRCGWLPLKAIDNHRELEPQDVIIQALNHVQWSSNNCAKLKLLFTKLPPIQVSMALRGMKKFREGLTFLILYKRAINEENFTPASFLRGIDDHMMLERRLKVLVLAYCLGFIREKRQTMSINDKSETSIVARIFHRIRAI